MFKAKPFVGVVAGVSAFSIIAFVMLSNSSSYVTIAQAKTAQGDSNHLSGDLVKDSVQVDSNNALITFDIVDESGDTMKVVHHGLPPANMGEATSVVVVGGYNGDHFESTKLLTKCPSKYESDEKTKPSLD